MQLRRVTESRRDSVMIQAYDRSKNLVASRTDLPSMAPRHLHDQASHVQSLEHPTDRMALASSLAVILVRSVQGFANLGVAEAPQQVLAIQHRLEQAHVRGAGGVEPGM